jgi:hypothetical protein
VHKLSVPDEEIVAVGSGLIVNTRDVEIEQPAPFEIVQVYVPAVVKLEITAVFAEKLLGPVQLYVELAEVPVADAVNVVLRPEQIALVPLIAGAVGATQKFDGW